jgi:hypothetical protein
MENKIRPVLSGIQVEATYRRQSVCVYRGNPFLEALPRIFSEAEMLKALSPPSFFKPAQINEAAHIRCHLVANLPDHFYVPFKRDVYLMQSIDIALREGYKARNFLKPEYIRMLRTKNVLNPGKAAIKTTARGFGLIGVSGVGKSSTCEMSLLTFPQVINHIRFKKRNFLFAQLVWLKLDCPQKGSVRALCFDFFHAVDFILHTNYYDKYSRRGQATAEEMLPHIALVSMLHGLGILVIDEIQNLVGAPDDMLKFFVKLENVIGVPVILVGTPQASKLFNEEGRQARRSTGPEMVSWDRFPKDDAWKQIIDGLFKNDWTRNMVPDQNMADIFYELTVGIPDFAVKLYVAAQRRAIMDEHEQITESLLREVASNVLERVEGSIRAINNNQLSGNKQVKDFVLTTTTEVNITDNREYAIILSLMQNENFRTEAMQLANRLNPSTGSVYPQEVTPPPANSVTMAREPAEKKSAPKTSIMKAAEKARKDKVLPSDNLMKVGLTGMSNLPELQQVCIPKK